MISLQFITANIWNEPVFPTATSSPSMHDETLSHSQDDYNLDVLQFINTPDDEHSDLPLTLTRSQINRRRRRARSPDRYRQLDSDRQRRRRRQRAEMRQTSASQSSELDFDAFNQEQRQAQAKYDQQTSQPWSHCACCRQLCHPKQLKKMTEYQRLHHDGGATCFAPDDKLCKSCKLSKRKKCRRSWEGNHLKVPERPSVLDLGFMELRCVQLIFPNMTIAYQVHGQPQMNGIKLISFASDPNATWNSTTPHTYPYLAVCQQTPDGTTSATYSFVVDVVRDALRWLHNNNPLYADVDVEQTLRQLYRQHEFGVQALVNDSHSYVPIHVVDSVGMLPLLGSVPLTAPLRTIPSLIKESVQRATAPANEEKAFPHIFCSGVNGESFDRGQKLTLREYHKLRIGCANNTFCADPVYVFRSVHVLQSHDMFRSINFVLKKMPEARPMSSEYLLKNVYPVVGKNLRGTNAYWSKARQKLHAMYQTLGAPTFFLTCNLSHCPDFLRHIDPDRFATDEAVDSISREELIQLASEHCGAYAKMFDNRLLEFLKYLKSYGIGGFKATEHFVKVEFQRNHLPHAHILLWCADAPASTESAFWVNWHDRHMSTQINPTDVDLRALVNKFQLHEHTFTCKNHRKSPSTTAILRNAGAATASQRAQSHPEVQHAAQQVQPIPQDLQDFLERVHCRFSYPFPEVEFTHFRSPAEAAVMLRGDRAIMLKRDAASSRVVAYNAKLLKMVRCNVDFQVVFDPEAVMHYLIAYMAKNASEEDDLLKQVQQQTALHPDDNVAVKLALIKYANTALTTRQIGKVEASMLVLSIPLYRSSLATVYVDVKLPSERSTFLKVTEQQLQEVNVEQHRQRTLLQRYCARPNSAPFDDMSLYEFAQWFERDTKAAPQAEDEDVINDDSDEERHDNIEQPEQTHDFDDTNEDEENDFEGAHDSDLESAHEEQDSLDGQQGNQGFEYGTRNELELDRASEEDNIGLLDDERTWILNPHWRRKRDARPIISAPNYQSHSRKLPRIKLQTTPIQIMKVRMKPKCIRLPFLSTPASRVYFPLPLCVPFRNEAESFGNVQTVDEIMDVLPGHRRQIEAMIGRQSMSVPIRNAVQAVLRTPLGAVLQREIEAPTDSATEGIHHNDQHHLFEHTNSSVPADLSSARLQRGQNTHLQQAQHPIQNDLNDELHDMQPLTVEQAEVVQTVEAYLRELTQWHYNVAIDPHAPKPAPFHLFVTGPGGTGKTFVIQRIRKVVRNWNAAEEARGFGRPRYNDGILVGAFTGVAAHTSGGRTLHDSLQIKVKGNGEVSDISDYKLHTLRQRHINDVLVILDELSLIKQQLLQACSLRLCQIHDNVGIPNMFFGNLPVLAFGDLAQLPPVGAVPIFAEPKNHGVNLYQLFEPIFFHTPVRQTDADFADALNGHIRWGKVKKGSHVDRKLVERCTDAKVNVNSHLRQHLEHLLATDFKDAVHLFGTNKECAHHNSKRLHDMASHIFFVRSYDVRTDRSDGVARAPSVIDLNDRPFGDEQAHLVTDNLDDNKTAALAAIVPLAKGARVMLRANLNTSDGLTNGAMGTIVDFEYTHDALSTHGSVLQTRECPMDTDCKHDHLPHFLVPVPSVVWVKFDGNAGRASARQLDGAVPIHPKTATFCLKHETFARTQIPLILAYGITVHKSQSCTLNKVVIHLQGLVPYGMFYTAISRVRTWADVILVTYDCQSIRADPRVLLEYERLADKIATRLSGGINVNLLAITYHF
jgi:ATP-dependent DNA helicase PIF1